MDPATIIAIVLGIIGGGGIAGAIVAIIKVRPEAGQIIVKSAEGAVIVQAGVINDLQDEIVRLQTRLTSIENTALAADVRTHQLESENAALKDRVRHLEAENIELREQVSIIRENGNGKE